MYNYVRHKAIACTKADLFSNGSYMQLLVNFESK